MKSYIAKPSDIDRKWYVIDAEGKTLGKLAVEAAMILRGKKKPVYTPHIDTGDYVIVVNAGNENSEKTQALVKAVQTDAVKEFILNTYNGAVQPKF